jgi:hypothetical protein
MPVQGRTNENHSPSKPDSRQVWRNFPNFPIPSSDLQCNLPHQFGTALIM